MVSCDFHGRSYLLLVAFVQCVRSRQLVMSEIGEDFSVEFLSHSLVLNNPRSAM